MDENYLKPCSFEETTLQRGFIEKDVYELFFFWYIRYSTASAIKKKHPRFLELYVGEGTFLIAKNTMKIYPCGGATNLEIAKELDIEYSSLEKSKDKVRIKYWQNWAENEKFNKTL